MLRTGQFCMGYLFNNYLRGEKKNTQVQSQIAKEYLKVIFTDTSISSTNSNHENKGELLTKKNPNSHMETAKLTISHKPLH